MTIKAILFDFGQVLNAPADAEADTAHRLKMAQLLGLKGRELWTYLFEGEPAGRWMTGRLSWDDFWLEVLAARDITDPEAVKSFSAEIFKGGEQIHPEMRALLHELHGRYQLGLISNADWFEDEIRHVLENNYGLPMTLFDVVVTSKSAGVVKPDPLIFQLALERLGVAPQEAIFIDDLESFTRSAATLGLHAHTFTTPAGLRHYLNALGIPFDQHANSGL